MFPIWISEQLLGYFFSCKVHITCIFIPESTALPPAVLCAQNVRRMFGALVVLILSTFVKPMKPEIKIGMHGCRIVKLSVL